MMHSTEAYMITSPTWGSFCSRTSTIVETKYSGPRPLETHLHGLKVGTEIAECVVIDGFISGSNGIKG